MPIENIKIYLNNFCLLFSNQTERPDQGRDAPKKTIKIDKINNKDTLSKTINQDLCLSRNS